MSTIKYLLFLAICLCACKQGSSLVSENTKKPLTQENLQGSWSSKPEGPAELRFEGDSIHFLDDQQSFKYMIVGDSIQFELEFATFWYKVELRGNDQMDFSTPQLSVKYNRIKS